MQIIFSVENIQVKSLIHLKEVVREFKDYEFIEGSTIQGFDLKCIFVAHLNFVGYTNISEILIP